MADLLPPVVIGAAVTAAGALAWIVFFPRVGTDLSAALARAYWASHYPAGAYLFSWYGGVHPASYSLLAPYLLAIAGTRLAMAAAAVVSAVLLTSLLVRHQVPRPRAAAVWVGVALWTELSAGRAAFTLGLAAALGCVVVADVSLPDQGQAACGGFPGLAVLPAQPGGSAVPRGRGCRVRNRQALGAGSGSGRGR